MLDCKRALEETGGDMEAARRWLREKGLAGAAKLAGREASQGAVALAVAGRTAAIVELRCETDFVAKQTSSRSLSPPKGKMPPPRGPKRWMICGQLSRRISR
jgi:elongation factor Ts